MIERNEREGGVSIRTPKWENPPSQSPPSPVQDQELIQNRTWLRNRIAIFTNLHLLSQSGHNAKEPKREAPTWSLTHPTWSLETASAVMALTELEAHRAYKMLSSS